MQGNFGSGGTGRAGLHERIASVQTDSTLTETRREDLASLYTNLDRFLGSLDSVNASGASTDSSRALGPNLSVVAVAEEGDGPRSAFEVTFPSAVMWALIGICMSFAISIVHERLTGTDEGLNRDVHVRLGFDYRAACDRLSTVDCSVFRPHSFAVSS